MHSPHIVLIPLDVHIFKDALTFEMENVSQTEDWRELIEITDHYCISSNR